MITNITFNESQGLYEIDNEFIIKKIYVYNDEGIKLQLRQHKIGDKLLPLVLKKTKTSYEPYEVKIILINDLKYTKNFIKEKKCNQYNMITNNLFIYSTDIKYIDNYKDSSNKKNPVRGTDERIIKVSRNNEYTIKLLHFKDTVRKSWAHIPFASYIEFKSPMEYYTDANNQLRKFREMFDYNYSEDLLQQLIFNNPCVDIKIKEINLENL